MKVNNIFKNIPRDLPEELIENITSSKNIKIERIISKGRSTNKDFWYNQDKDEFVLLLQGEAELLFESGLVKMNKGDYLIIPKHKKHQVKSTSNKEETIWLTVFY